MQYFKLRDSEIATNQRGLMHTVNGLSSAIVKTYVGRSCNVFEHRPPYPEPLWIAPHLGADFGVPLNEFFWHKGSRCQGIADYDNDTDKANKDKDFVVIGAPSAPIPMVDNTPKEDSTGHIDISADDLM
jgi:hypothetical protein